MFGKAHPTSKKKILVVGSGPTSIGLGTDRDYAVVNCINTLKDFGYSTILLNNNPAAVSTDPGVADTLYLDPITDEDVRNVVFTENRTELFCRSAVVTPSEKPKCFVH